MWYASPPEPCWTEIPTAAFVFFFVASACASSCAQFFGAFASFVLVTSAMFSSETGAP